MRHALIRLTLLLLGVLVLSVPGLRAAAAEEPPELTKLLTNAWWQTNWPPIWFPGPVVDSLTDFKPLPDGFEFSVGFLRGTNGIRGLVPPLDYPERILGQAMTNFFQIDVLDLNNQEVPVQVVSVEPPQLAPDVDHYRLRVRFMSLVSGSDRKLKVTARNRYRVQQAAYRDQHSVWLTNNLPVILASLAILKQPTNRFEVFLAGVQSLGTNEQFRRTFYRAATNELGAFFEKTKGEISTNSIAAALNPSFANYLGVFRDDITRLLYTNVAALKKWQAATPPPSSTNAPLTAENCQELFWLMICHYFRFTGGTQKDFEPLAQELVLPPQSAEFQWTGRIAGFTVLVQKLEPLPEKETASLFGRGIANHFHVFRVALLNTNASSVLIYGDQITLECRVREFSFKEPRDFRKLLESVPDRDLYVEPENGTTNRHWKTSATGRKRGEVRDLPNKMLARPYNLHFLIRGYEDREFNTTKARVFRTLNVVADSAAAVIPFVGRQGYSDGSGIFSGVFVPATKKLFGDSTEVQRQTFLLESMPPYVELDRGQSISRYIYFPKYGLTGVTQDKVRFLTEFGNAQEAVVTVAILIKPGATASPPAP